ncbi:MAG: GatB/YqeY domain-containing protein [Gammaproteobacteria bacterium]|nr:GatB/YqeY domain-containing protein [Gammaproteobacteria bacterium]
MALKAKIQQDMKDAMRGRETLRLESIRLLRAAIQRQEVDSRTELDDTGVLAVIQKLIKQGQDAAAQFEQGARPELAAKELAQIEHFKAYLPAPLGDTELREIIDAAIAASGATGIRDMGAVMAALKSEIQGRADMAAVSRTVKSVLGAD